MPHINLNRTILSPMFCDEFSVVRRAEVLTDGVVSVASTTTASVKGTVTAASGSDLERLDDNDRAGRHLSIVTKHRLQMTTPGFKPDLVLWEGDSFVVKALDPYPQFGAGWVQAIVGSIDHQDQPVP